MKVIFFNMNDFVVLLYKFIVWEFLYFNFDVKINLKLDLEIFVFLVFLFLLIKVSYFRLFLWKTNSIRY